MDDETDNNAVIDNYIDELGSFNVEEQCIAEKHWIKIVVTIIICHMIWKQNIHMMKLQKRMDCSWRIYS